MTKKVLYFIIFIFQSYLVLACSPPCMLDDFDVCTCPDSGDSPLEKKLDEMKEKYGIQLPNPEYAECVDSGCKKMKVNGEYTQGGVTYSGENIIIDENGNIVEFESLKVDGNTFENGKNFKRIDAGSYTMDSADYIDDGKRQVVKGTFVKGSNSDFEAETSETVNDKEKGSVTSETTNYKSEDDNFELESAKAVVVDNTIFADIGPSAFEMDGTSLIGADVFSAKDNNTFKIGKLEINIDADDEFIMEKVDISNNPSSDVTLTPEDDTEKYSTKKYNLEIISDNATVIDYELEVQCITIGAGSRYNYEGDSVDQFSFRIPKGADPFRLCIRTFYNESFDMCPSCGIMDFIDRKLMIQGEAEYERKGEFLSFQDIIESNSINNSINMSLTGTIKKDVEDADFYSGTFHIRMDPQTKYRWWIDTPYILSKLENININKKGSLKRISEDNTFTMYAINSENYNDFIARFEGLK